MAGLSNPVVVLPPRNTLWATTNVGGSVNGDQIPIVWNNVLDSVGTAIVLVNSRIEFPRGGRFDIVSSIHTTGTTARINVMLAARLNGNQLLPGRGASGYIRAATGHNQSSSSTHITHNASPGDFIELVGIQEANGGNATLVANSSSLLVKEVR